MNPYLILNALLLLGMPAAPETHTDFIEVDYTKIERRIRKEPTYTAQPLYALFILDPQAKFRVWAVLDKSKADLPYYDVLYFDRNGNGDLTEPGERFVGRLQKDEDHGEIWVTILVGDVPVPGTSLIHREFAVSPPYRNRRNDEGIWFTMKWCGGEYITGGYGPAAYYNTVYAKSPDKAPILRPSMQGPLAFELYGWGAKVWPLPIGKESNVYVMAGSRGSGPDTFCPVRDDYLDRDKDTILATLIAKDKEGLDVRTVFTLPDPC